MARIASTSEMCTPSAHSMVSTLGVLRSRCTLGTLLHPPTGAQPCPVCRRHQSSAQQGPAQGRRSRTDGGRSQGDKGAVGWRCGGARTRGGNAQAPWKEAACVFTYTTDASPRAARFCVARAALAASSKKFSSGGAIKTEHIASEIVTWRQAGRGGGGGAGKQHINGWGGDPQCTQTCWKVALHFIWGESIEQKQHGRDGDGRERM
jgi:hypothetical protein